MLFILPFSTLAVLMPILFAILFIELGVFAYWGSFFAPAASPAAPDPAEAHRPRNKDSLLPPVLFGAGFYRPLQLLRHRFEFLWHRGGFAVPDSVLPVTLFCSRSWRWRGLRCPISFFHRSVFFASEDISASWSAGAARSDFRASASCPRGRCRPTPGLDSPAHDSVSVLRFVPALFFSCWCAPEGSSFPAREPSATAVLPAWDLSRSVSAADVFHSFSFPVCGGHVRELLFLRDDLRVQ
jgi:hypothetical protein